MRMRCVCRNTGIIHRIYFQWRIFRIETKKNQFNRMKCMKFGNLHNYICGKCCLNAFLFIKWNSLSMESIEISKEFFLFCIVLKITRFENCWHRNKDIFHWRWEETKKKHYEKPCKHHQAKCVLRSMSCCYIFCMFFFFHSHHRHKIHGPNKTKVWEREKDRERMFQCCGFNVYDFVIKT